MRTASSRSVDKQRQTQPPPLKRSSSSRSTKLSNSNNVTNEIKPDATTGESSLTRQFNDSANTIPRSDSTSDALLPLTHLPSPPRRSRAAVLDSLVKNNKKIITRATSSTLAGKGKTTPAAPLTRNSDPLKSSTESPTKDQLSKKKVTASATTKPTSSSSSSKSTQLKPKEYVIRTVLESLGEKKSANSFTQSSKRSSARLVQKELPQLPGVKVNKSIDHGGNGIEHAVATTSIKLEVVRQETSALKDEDNKYTQENKLPLAHMADEPISAHNNNSISNTNSSPFLPESDDSTFSSDPISTIDPGNRGHSYQQRLQRLKKAATFSSHTKTTSIPSSSSSAKPTAALRIHHSNPFWPETTLPDHPLRKSMILNRKRSPPEDDALTPTQAAEDNRHEGWQNSKVDGGDDSYDALDAKVGSGGLAPSAFNLLASEKDFSSPSVVSVRKKARHNSTVTSPSSKTKKTGSSDLFSDNEDDDDDHDLPRSPMRIRRRRSSTHSNASAKSPSGSSPLKMKAPFSGLFSDDEDDDAKGGSQTFVIKKNTRTLSSHSMPSGAMMAMMPPPTTPTRSTTVSTTMLRPPTSIATTAVTTESSRMENESEAGFGAQGTTATNLDADKHDDKEFVSSASFPGASPPLLPMTSLQIPSSQATFKIFRRSQTMISKRGEFMTTLETHSHYNATSAEFSHSASRKSRHQSSNQNQTGTASSSSASYSTTEVSKVAPFALPSYMPNPTVEECQALPRSDFRPKPHDTTPRVSPQTVVDVLEGKFKDRFDEIFVIDCRFPYEFEGGHIRGAVNVNTPDELEKLLLRPARTDKRVLLIFHCEFSCERGPRMARHLRNQDRFANVEHYPALFYPEVYVMQNGYSAFFKNHKDYCWPVAYVPMLSKD
ncbi:cell division cycle- protein [Gryganskiella cystojenkinii]|nr:cell division cycle- protein [Gryganskiella cystojenkinii]